jgi:alcohol dehydrogenase class IV
MKNFNYYQTTEIIYGIGRIKELGKIAKRFGKRCLLVTTPSIPALKHLFKRAEEILIAEGLKVKHFDKVEPNPTTDIVTAGAKIAKKFNAEVIIGLGGGSSMDTAKAIAVEATHEGTAWDYLYFRKKQPTKKTLPIIAVSTTSGTGSQVTQVAVVTNTKERNKSAIFNSIIYPKVAIVDPELMLTLPKSVTAPTGFDAFCHAFESVVHINNSPLVDVFAWKAIEIVINTLPYLLEHLDDIDARAKMAYADTLAGLAIANVGVTLPHGIGMAISGLYPHVAHGASLAIVYPAFTRFTFNHSLAQFSKLGKLFNPKMLNESEEKLAERSIIEVDEFLKKIGLYKSLKDYEMPENEIELLAKNSMILPDYTNNPRLATDKEMLEIIKQLYYLK